MPTLAEVLSYLPTLLFWVGAIFLVVSELIGKFAKSLRWRFRFYALFCVLGIGIWWASETANHVQLTMPDLQPWSRIISQGQAQAHG